MDKTLVLGFLLVLSGCRSLPTSDLAHEVDRPMLDPVPAQWVAISDEEFRTAMMSGFEKEYKVKSEALVGEDYPARRILQTHIDRIDARLRKDHPELLRGIPKPRAQLLLSPLSNAYVSPTSVCINRKATLETFQGTKADRFWEFDAASSQFTADPFPEAPVLCVHRTFSDKALKELIGFQIEGRTKCRIDIKKSLGLSKECQSLFSNPEGRPNAADDFSFILLPDSIFFLSGLIEDYSEEELIYWIAHEMAHYYRAHRLTPQKDFKIYYRLGATNAKGRPKNDKELQDFAGKVEALRDKMGEKGLSALSAAERKEWQDLSVQAYEEKIGQYTAEQEADELALEWFLDDGFDSATALAAAMRHLELYGPNSRKSADYDWNYERCREAFDKGWKDEKEYPAFVPLGDLSDDHHSSCYRAFNLYREIQTHRYPAEAKGQKPSLTKDWKALQATLKKEAKAMKD